MKAISIGQIFMVNGLPISGQLFVCEGMEVLCSSILITLVLLCLEGL